MKNQLKALFLLGAIGALLVGCGALLGTGWAIAALAFALVLNVSAYFFSDRVLLRMHGAQPLSREEAPRIHAMVEEMAQRAGIPMPRLVRIADAQPNAFATGRNPKHGVVAVTDGIVRILSERELRGVIAHEVAHIKNRDILVSTLAAVAASAISMIGNFLPFSLLGGGDEEEAPSPFVALAAAFVAPLVGTMIQFAISRSREYLADEEAARLGGDPEALASALERLEHAAFGIASDRAQPAAASLYIVNPLRAYEEFGPAGAGPHSSLALRAKGAPSRDRSAFGSAGAFASQTLTGGERLSRLFSTHPPTAERVRRLRQLATTGWQAA
ncbi:M48 family metalloprotease [Vulgatibacter sp.]|uniref:M48 family metalloprotease n=1 Tax=Vulgatibacter sp. TaxID=1971226 RepID=UPI003569CC4B